MSTMLKTQLARLAAVLCLGVMTAMLSPPVNADELFGWHFRHHHRYWHWHRHAAIGYLYAYGDAPRHRRNFYYFTSSNFCMPAQSNGYNGGFAMPAYNARGWFLGYVCD